MQDDFDAVAWEVALLRLRNEYTESILAAMAKSDRGSLGEGLVVAGAIIPGGCRRFRYPGSMDQRQSGYSKEDGDPRPGFCFTSAQVLKHRFQ